MKYLFFYFIAPAAVSFLVQGILCRKAKKGMLRHGALVFPVISVSIGVTMLLAQYGDVFAGLGTLAAIFWFITACGAVLGYGTAWLVFLMTRKGRKQGNRGSL